MEKIYNILSMLFDVLNHCRIAHDTGADIPQVHKRQKALKGIASKVNLERKIEDYLQPIQELAATEKNV